MSDHHQLEKLEGPGDDLASAEWPRLPDGLFGRAASALLAMGLAVRVSTVGYGRALRIGATDGRGWSCGWTLGSPEELSLLCNGLLAPGAEDYVLKRLEKPQRRR